MRAGPPSRGSTLEAARRWLHDGLTLVVLAAIFGPAAAGASFVAAEVATTLAEAAGLPLALPRPHAAELATAVGLLGLACAALAWVRADAPRDS